jgi:hypothetical protein
MERICCGGNIEKYRSKKEIYKERQKKKKKRKRI